MAFHFIIAHMRAEVVIEYVVPGFYVKLHIVYHSAVEVEDEGFGHCLLYFMRNKIRTSFACKPIPYLIRIFTLMHKKYTNCLKNCTAIKSDSGFCPIHLYL